MSRVFWIIGSLIALLGVGAGAFGAHALQTRVPEDLLATFETGARYQMYHAFGLLGVGWAASEWPNGFVVAAGWLFLAGILVFSGSLYILALTGVRWLGAITPIGGVAMLAGWLSLAVGIWRG